MMIQANELRIGNYVNVPSAYQSPFRIDLMEYVCEGFAKVGMNVHKYENPFKPGELINGHPLTWDLNELSGIELTGQILLDCGFEVSYSSKSRLRMDLITDTSFGFDFDINGDYNSMQGFRHYGRYYDCKSLHTLQNMYYFMSVGKELTYAPPLNYQVIGTADMVPNQPTGYHQNINKPTGYHENLNK